MAKDAKIDLMLTKEDIAKAIEESHIVKEKYPAFWKLYKMIEEMNFELTALQDAMEKKGKGGRR